MTSKQQIEEVKKMVSKLTAVGMQATIAKKIVAEQYPGFCKNADLFRRVRSVPKPKKLKESEVRQPEPVYKVPHFDGWCFIYDNIEVGPHA